MGKRNRERIERIRRGEEEPIAAKVPIASKVLNNPVSRKAVALASRGDVIKTLEQASTEEQIETLDRTVAGQKPDKLRRALMKKAPKEMDKAIQDFLKKGKPVTVETLTEEARNTPSFVRLCEGVGLEMSWFDELAKERMKVHGITGRSNGGLNEQE